MGAPCCRPRAAAAGGAGGGGAAAAPGTGRGTHPANHDNRFIVFILFSVLPLSRFLLIFFYSVFATINSNNSSRLQGD